MSFTVERLRSEVEARTNAGGSAVQDALYLALADVVSDIQIESVLTPTTFDIDAPATSIDLDVKYYSCVRDGVLYYMGQDKRYSATGEVTKRDRYDASLARLKAIAMIDEDGDQGMNFEI